MLILGRDQKIFDLSKFDFDSTTPVSKFLTARPTTTVQPNDLKGRVAQLTSANDYQTMAMFNERDTYFNTENGRLIYKFYEDVPDTLGESDNYVGVISVWNGDKAGVEQPDLSTTEDKALTYVACGGANVMKMEYAQYGGYTPTAAIKYYSLQYISTQEESQAVIHPNKIKAGEYIEITTVGNTDWVSIGAASNTLGVLFYATGSAHGSGAWERFMNTRNSPSLISLKW